MKQIFFSVLTLLIALSVIANPSIQKSSADITQNQELKNTFKKYLIEENVAKKDELRSSIIDFFYQIKEGKNSNAKQSNLKSTLDLTHNLDSLLVDRWNENTGQLEASQLEKWTWYENGLAESWELFDIDSDTKQWIPNDKEAYEWDTEGNKILHIDYDPDTITGGWLLNGKEIRTFDTNNNPLTNLLQFWNRTTNSWEDTAKSKYSYDPDGRKTESLTSIWDKTTTDWVNSEKITSIYDANGTLLKDEIFVWDTTQNNWVTNAFNRFEYDENGYVNLQELVIEEFFFHFLIEYVNDSNGNELEVISWNWDFMTNTYFPMLKNTHTYSLDGNELSWSHYTWDATNSDWLISWKRNYQYDENGFLIYSDGFLQNETLNKLLIRWNNMYVNNADGNPIFKSSMKRQSATDEWTNDYKEHYTYDSQKRKNYIDRFNWNSIANDWVGDFKEIKNYDDSWNFLLHSRQNYDTLSHQWVDEFKEEYSYDLSIEFSSISYPSEWPSGSLSNLYYYDQYNNAMLQNVYSEIKDGQLKTSQKFTFYYSSKITTALTEIKDEAVIVYPNPATDFVKFEIHNASVLSRIELYDMQGRKVISKWLPPTNQISLRHLKTGAYLYKLIQGREIKQGKIIKK